MIIRVGEPHWYLELLHEEDLHDPGELCGEGRGKGGAERGLESKMKDRKRKGRGRGVRRRPLEKNPAGFPIRGCNAA